MLLSAAPTTLRAIRCSRTVHRASATPKMCPTAAYTPQTPSPAHSEEGTILVSFDVDGTLIHSVGELANKLHKDAFKTAFKEVFGIDTHIDVVKHHGGTDPLICIKVLEHSGISREEASDKLPALKQAMIDHFLANQDKATVGLEILPGVRELLTRLKAHGKVATCLVTGNLEPIGWTKMLHLGIQDLFTTPLFGGFGTDFCEPAHVEESWKDRCEFVNIAAAKCLTEYGGSIKARFHVGDTPMDIQAAIGAGAVPIGVATGIFSKAELLECAGGRGVVLDDLADVEAVLASMGLGMA